MKRQAARLALMLGLAACSAESAPPSRSGRAGAATSPIDATGKCTRPGPVRCYCDDGQPRGNQLCSADGTLTSCACASVIEPGSGSAGASASAAPVAPTVEDRPLCPQLQGNLGCAAKSYQSSELPASVLFVVDRSGSMACNPPPLQDSASCESSPAPVDGTRPSKWQITVGALKQVFTRLIDDKSTARVGLTFFSNDNTCGVQSTPTVPVEPLTAVQGAVLSSALDSITPNGGTPIVGATTLAYAYLHQEATLSSGCSEPCGARGNRYVVLITDGTDSCPMPSRAEDAAACSAAGSCTNYLVDEVAPAAASANIRTFVIGAPGSEPARGYLSELAYVGGTARNGGNCVHEPSGAGGDCHFDMTSSADFAAALGAALGEISGAALGCEFAVPEVGEPITAELVNVQFQASDPAAASVCFGFDERDCDSGANGWQFAKKSDGTQDLTRVVLCGQACSMVRADAGAKVDVVLGCETIGPQ